MPLRPGQIERRTYDYQRDGTRSLYAAFDILTGQVMDQVTQKHRAREFLAFLHQVDRNTPKDKELHLILDNNATHKTEEVRKWFARHPRIKLHFTTTSASWLNAVESRFSQLERRAMYRGVFCSVNELHDAIHRYIIIHNEKHAKPLKWTKKASTILDSVQRVEDALFDTIN